MFFIFVLLFSEDERILILETSLRNVDFGLAPYELLMSSVMFLYYCDFCTSPQSVLTIYPASDIL